MVPRGTMPPTNTFPGPHHDPAAHVTTKKPQSRLTWHSSPISNSSIWMIRANRLDTHIPVVDTHVEKEFSRDKFDWYHP